MTQHIRFDYGQPLVKDVYSAYNGRCKSFDFGPLIVPNRNLARFFVSPENGELDVYFLEDTEDLLFFTIIARSENVPSLTLSTNAVVTLGQTTWNYLPTDDRPCDPEITDTHFKQCIVHELEKLYRVNEYECAPIQFRRVYTQQKEYVTFCQCIIADDL